MSSEALPGQCLNCRAPLAGPYCSACGQKATAPNPTFGELVHEFRDELLQVDGRLWRSIRLLFARPGWLTQEHWSGRRASYLPPLRLYLIFSVVFFGALALTPARTTVTHDERMGDVVETGGVRISGERLIAGRTPQQVGDIVRHVFHDWVPRLMLAMVPVWALLVMLVTRSARRHFPEHMVFALHANAAFTGAWIADHFAGLTPWHALGTAATIAAVMYILWYKVVGMRRVYGGGWLRNVARTLTVTVAYVCTVILAIALVVLVALLN